MQAEELQQLLDKGGDGLLEDNRLHPDLLTCLLATAEEPYDFMRQIVAMRAKLPNTITDTVLRRVIRAFRDRWASQPDPDRRYQVVSSNDRPDSEEYSRQCWVLVDTRTDEEVFCDLGEPEDMILVGDLSDLVDLINEKQVEIDRLRCLLGEAS